MSVTSRESLRTRDYRKLIVQFLGGKCVLCACANFEYLEIHHKDDNPYNNEVHNLLLLCRKCHRHIHAENGRSSMRRMNSLKRMGKTARKNLGIGEA